MAVIKDLVNAQEQTGIFFPEETPEYMSYSETHSDSLSLLALQKHIYLTTHK